MPAWQGQETTNELRRLAAAGLRPRMDYVELARVLDADVTDFSYMSTRATWLARLLARRLGLVPAQLVEAFMLRNKRRYLVARADRLGLPLAAAFKLFRSRRDTVLISVYLSRRKKAIFLRPLGAYSHLHAIINYGSIQMNYATDKLGVPRPKVHHALQPVDEIFWQPVVKEQDVDVFSVGWEARDYPTLLEALHGLNLRIELAIGSTVLASSGEVEVRFAPTIRATTGKGLPPNVRLHQQADHLTLRDLYARSRVVVVPLHDVDFDAGVTTMTEAMAMGKPVVVTRTRGQVDLIEEGKQGLYVPPNDPAALRRAIVYLLDHEEEAARMGRAGRQLVESRHTLDGWIRQVSRVVHSVPAPGYTTSQVTSRGSAEAQRSEVCTTRKVQC